MPSNDNQTILDVVTWVQQNADPTLSYRYACRVGMCGSCAMMVNGVPRWTCRTHVAKVLKDNKLEIAPLRNLPVIKDLATDMDPFFDKWVGAEGVFHPSATRSDDIAPIEPATPARRNADAGIECINCAVCYAACDTVSGNPDYLGPAALNRAWTLLNDAKDDGRAKILDAVAAKGGCHCMSQHGELRAALPQRVEPDGGDCWPETGDDLGFLPAEAVMEARLYMLQRLSALVMVPLVLGHIAVMIHAVQGGVSAGEMLERTQDSVAWALFYGTFVVAVSVHGAIGLRNILIEWGGIRGNASTALTCVIVFIVLLWLGARAVIAAYTGWKP